MSFTYDLPVLRMHISHTHYLKWMMLVKPLKGGAYLGF